MGAPSNFNRGGHISPICADRGKKHQGECRRISRTFYQYGKMGHLVRDCPGARQNSNKTITSSSSSASISVLAP